MKKKIKDETTKKPERNHRGHRGILIDKKRHKVFQSAQSISLFPLWFLCG